MGNYKIRLRDESAALKIKIEKLETFIVSKGFDELPNIEREDLKQQYEYMQKYNLVLTRRISRLT